MKPASKNLASRLALALLTLLGGAPAASLSAQEEILQRADRPAKFGNDGVGGIEKTPGSGPVGKAGPGGNSSGPTLSKPTVMPGPWTDLGESLGKDSAAPVLTGSGTGEPGTLVTLTLSGAEPGTVAALFIGLAKVNVPFKGGTLVPAPMLIVQGLPVNAQGGFTLPALLPASLPSGLALYAQMWMPDSGAVAGFASTNGLELLIP